MSPITPTPEQLINAIVTAHYHNDVTFHHVYNPIGGHYIVRCETCQQMGLPWSYTLDTFTMHSHPDQWLGMLREVLVQHALKHNDLVRDITNTFNLVRKHQGVVAGCPSGHQASSVQNELEEFLKHMEYVEKRVNKESDTKKPNEFRKIELIELSDEK
jgi:hypothetical protein